MVNILDDGDARTTLRTKRQERKSTEAQLARSRSTPRRDPFLDDSVPQSALQQPAEPGIVQVSEMGFAVTAAGGVVLERTFTVPTRMRSAVISLHGRVYAANGSAAAGDLSARAEIQALKGNAVPIGVAPGNRADNPVSFSQRLADLMPAQQLVVRVWAKTSNADWPADAVNLAELSGVIAWSA